MKDVIDGRLYDTDAETTEHIATHNPVADRGDFAYLCERLHKTTSGEYFIAGEGGPKTKYSKRVGTGEYSGSSEIRPLSFAHSFRRGLQDVTLCAHCLRECAIQFGVYEHNKTDSQTSMHPEVER